MIDHESSGGHAFAENMQQIASCYSCSGSAVRQKRIRREGRWVREERTCNACSGLGYIVRSRRKDAAGNFVKKHNRKSYPSFSAPGPHPLGDRGRPELQERTCEELCYLVGNWRIFQEINRHRYSTDDLVTSWVAVVEARRFGLLEEQLPTAVLDIGCGIGSVLLSNAWQLPYARCVGLEAQPERFAQAVRSITYNIGEYPVEQDRVNVINCDIRDPCLRLTREFPEGFDIITGTPPYFDVEQVIRSKKIDLVVLIHSLPIA